MRRSLRVTTVVAVSAIVAVADMPPVLNLPDRTIPIASTSPSIVYVAAGQSHSLARRFDGTVWSWGNTGSGRLGRSGDPLLPAQITSLSGIVAVAAGGFHSLAIRGSDGSVWAWGGNVSGQLGNGSTSDSMTPVAVSGLTNITAVAAGENHSLALRNDGTVWAWGLNDQGQVGDGANLVQDTPFQTAMTTATAIAAGHSHSLALKNTGVPFAWGRNNRGQLGYGFVGVSSATPTAVVGLSGVKTLAARSFQSLASRASNGSVVAWGANGDGQLGDNSTTDRSRFVNTATLVDTQVLVSGGNHSLAATADGALWGWGANDSGQMGDPNSAADHLVAFKIPNFTVFPPPVSDPQTCGGRFGHAVATTVRQGEVDTATGIFSSSSTDASMAGMIGVPFSFVRTYNSRCGGSGSLSQGWTHNYNASLSIGVPAAGQITFFSDDGQTFVYKPTGPTTYKGPAGSRSRLSAVTGGYELVTHDQLHYRFGPSGRLDSVKDRNDRGITLAYNGSGQLVTATDAVGRVVNFGYSGTDPLIRSLTLADGRSLSYNYTAAKLSSVVDRRAKTWSYAYDTGGRLSKITDPNGHDAVTVTYDPATTRVLTQRDGVGNQGTFAWDPASQTSTYTDPRGGAWTDRYENNVLARSTNPRGEVIRYDYSSNLDRQKVTDPRGNTTIRNFDDNGNMTSITAPAPLSYNSTFTYDAMNNLKTSTNARGKLTTYDYDTAGNLTRQTRPAGAVTSYGRDPAGTGLMVSSTDPRNNLTTFSYDTAGNMASMTMPAGGKTTYGYDLVGRRSSMTEPRGNVAGAVAADYTTTYAYNDNDQLTSETDPLGNVTASSYDDAGLLDTTTDAMGKVTDHDYDNADRLRTLTHPDLTTTLRAYDPNGNVITRTDANGHSWSFTFDMANRQLSSTSPMGRKWVNGYDAAGNPNSLLDPNGATTSFAYDQINRLQTIDYPTGTPDVTLGYDPNSNRTSMADGSGTITYSYDDLDRRTGSARGAETFSYGYDTASNLTRRTYPDSTANTYTYDDDSRLASVSAGTLTQSYGYDAAGNLTTSSGAPIPGLPPLSGVLAFNETRTWDRAGRLTQVANSTLGGGTRTYSYTLDPLGRPSTSSEPTGPVAYLYDNRDRLTKACYAASCAGAGDFIAYGYDNVANRTSQTRPTGTTTYSYDNDDRLLSSTGAGASTYSYDPNGNQTAAGTASFTYDTANRMTSLRPSPTATPTTYSYDGDGVRLSRATGAALTSYAWDTNADLADLALERDGTGAVLRRYTYGQGPVAMTTGSTDHTFQHDRLGSVTALNDALGQVEASYSYEPFGAYRSAPTGPANPMGFTGAYTDAESGLLHLRARQYDTGTGRFLTRDPVEGGSCNDYDYVCGDPVNGIDPSGECIQVWQERCRGEKSIWVTSGRWVNENRWKIAGFAVSGVCIAASAGAATAPCLVAGAALLTAKEYSTFKAGGSAGDHLWNIGSTWLMVAGASGWAAAGLRGWQGAGAGLLGETPSLACSSVQRCASPGLPR